MLADTVLIIWIPVAYVVVYPKEKCRSGDAVRHVRKILVQPLLFDS